jgi:hypothetical protein
MLKGKLHNDILNISAIIIVVVVIISFNIGEGIIT